MNYIDIKITLWNRVRFRAETDMKKLVELINYQGIDAIIDDKLGFMECETLYETEEKIHGRSIRR